MNPELADALINGLSGLYTERRRLLSEMCEMSDILDSKRVETTLIPPKIQYKLYRCIVGQVACVERIDKQLKRMNTALKGKRAQKEHKKSFHSI